MKSLPARRAHYVVRIIAAGIRACSRPVSFPTHFVGSPSLLLGPAAALVDHLGLQGQPAAGAQLLDDVGVVRGGFRLAAAARPERDDARRGGERVQPVHVPDQGTQPDPSHALQHGVPGGDGAGRRPRLPRLGGEPGMFTLADDGQAARRRGDVLLRDQHAAPSPRRSRSRCGSRSARSGTRTSCGARRATSSAPAPRRRWRWIIEPPSQWFALAAAGGAALPDLSHLQGLPRADRRRTPSRARDGGPAPGDDRGARAGDRREGSDLAARTSGACSSMPRPGARRWAWARTRCRA